jgi:GxxExxY protein
MEMLHEELTDKIIGIFYRVYNTLGHGFLEKVYENALAIEFEEAGLKFGKQVPIEVSYKERVVGNYFADFIVDGKVVVEVKAVERFCEKDGAQLVNYLKGTGVKVGLLLNFGEKADFKRRVFERARLGCNGV